MLKTTLDLCKNNWLFKEFPAEARKIEDLEQSSWFAAKVPCSVYASLINSNQIDRNQLYLYPEKFGWVAEKAWIYKTEFTVSDKLIASDEINLVLQGMDTYCCVWLNGKILTKTNNYFITHRLNIKESLKAGVNVLYVKFEPPVKFAKNQMEKYTIFKGDDFRNPERVYSRKPQYSFGWDWCPSLPGGGIREGAKIEFSGKACFSDVHIRTIDCNQHYADVKITAELREEATEKLYCGMTISGTALKLEQTLIFNPGESINSAVFRIERPFMWWPRGYGIQYLYNFSAQLKCDGQKLDGFETNFGIRTVKVHQEKDAYGQSFEFFVNDQLIKIKGASWVPVSMLGEDTDADYENLLGLAADANFNMLRVWGGGGYEKNLFYQLCDQHGILVWQDFMFACGQYPDKQWFVDEVEAETEDVIKRLRNFASIAIWCGNNECQWLHKIGALGKNKKFNGQKIFDELLPRLTQKLDPDRDYINTTPTGNPKDYNNPSHGTCHNWNIWAGDWPVVKYITEPVPRFAAEFGFQSLPDVKTLSGFIPENKLRIGSYEIEKINYQNGQSQGTSKINRYTYDLFRHTSELEDFIYLSQLTQARAMKLYIEHLRANGKINSGALFWQFNECFPAVSWSAIDYLQNPKAFYYYAKRFYCPIIITLSQEFDKPSPDSWYNLKSASACVVNDLATSITGEILCQLLDFNGNCIDQTSSPSTIMPHSASTPVKLPAGLVNPEQPSQSLLYIRLVVEGKTLAQNTHLYVPDKYIEWPAAKIIYEIANGETDGNYILNIKSAAFVKDLCITSNMPVKLNHNYIDVIPDIAVGIPFSTECDVRKIEFSFRSVNSVVNKKASN